MKKLLSKTFLVVFLEVFLLSLVYAENVDVVFHVSDHSWDWAGISPKQLFDGDTLSSIQVINLPPKSTINENQIREKISALLQSEAKFSSGMSITWCYNIFRVVLIFKSGKVYIVDEFCLGTYQITSEGKRGHVSVLNKPS